MTGVCKLCLTEKELRQSHVVPEFMYQNIYDKNPKRFYSLSVNLDSDEESKRKIEQKGIREYLLCGECEGLIGKYEGYAAETIYAKNKGNKTYIVKAQQTKNQDYFSYNYAGFEYKEFRIFLLSLLWRVIISKTFNTPDVNANEIEILRKAIKSENPLEYDDFGCLMQVIKYKKGELAKGYILDPFLTQNENIKVLNIFIDGFMYSFYLNSKELADNKKIHFLKPDGTMTIMGRILFNDPGLFERIKRAFGYFKTTLEK